MNTWRPTPLRLRTDLGRGGGAHSFEQGFGVMTHRAPFENGLCGPNEDVGADGRCHPTMEMGQYYRRPIDDQFCTSEEYMGWDGFCHSIHELGQTMPAAPAPAAPAVPGRTSIGATAAIVGLSAAGVQILTGDGLLGKIAFWAEIAALAVLAGVVLKMPECK